MHETGSVAAGGKESGAAVKSFRAGTERTVHPSVTLERARRTMSELGITRIADITGLDRVGVPVVSVFRPNARSLSVAQGKGASLLAAQVSGLMESIESYHAEHVSLPLLLGSYRELRARHRVVDAAGLPRLSVSGFNTDQSLLWVTGTELLSGRSALVPYEMVHLDYRLPLPTGSGAFVMSSNGLASGNHLLEALSHAICELVERDANTLWHYSDPESRKARRLIVDSIDDDPCLSVIESFDRAALDLAIWETTTEVGISSFLCTVVDRDVNVAWPMPPVPGSGCHPRRAVALLRALTEAAQGRLTIISGARDDLGERRFDPTQARDSSRRFRAEMRSQAPTRMFVEACDAVHDDFDGDVRWELECLYRAGLHEIVAVNLTKPELGMPVVRVVIPHLETMSELPGFVAGRRARKTAAMRAS